MDKMIAIKNRHTVRSYTDQKIEGEALSLLQKEISDCNGKSGLNIQLVTNEPRAFSVSKLWYGRLENVKNYIAIVGKKSDKLDELAGYFGERIVIKAQELGLNTCWVGLTFSKSKSREFIVVEKDEKFVIAIAIGYGKTSGVPHKSKALEELSNIKSDSPEWFKNGFYAASLAPTSINQQKFYFELNGSKVTAKAKRAIYAKLDLDIAKYHFEIGSGNYKFEM